MDLLRKSRKGYASGCAGALERETSESCLESRAYLPKDVPSVGAASA